MKRPGASSELFRALLAWCNETYPGQTPERLRVYLLNGPKIDLPVIPSLFFPSEADEPEPFVPTPFQEALLNALDGVALRTDALGEKVKDRSRLFRNPGGIKELIAQDLVRHHKRLGYYRPDSPPDQLPADEIDQ